MKIVRTGIPGPPVVARVALAASALLTLAAAEADEGSSLARQHACTTCHAMDAKLVGPSFKAIAQKYKADATAADKLAAGMLKGSQGKWGPIPMPPVAGLTDQDAKALAQWIMSLP